MNFLARVRSHRCVYVFVFATAHSFDGMWCINTLFRVNRQQAIFRTEQNRETMLNIHVNRSETKTESAPERERERDSEGVNVKNVRKTFQMETK